jgi:hypothetical protein
MAGAKNAVIARRHTEERERSEQSDVATLSHR